MSDKAFGSTHQQVVMPLFKKHEGNYIAIGTGFVIGADGLMVTASHVVLDVIAAGQRVLGEDGRWMDAFEFYALYVTAEKHGPNNQHNLGGLWPIQKAWCNNSLDIGLCWLQRAMRDDKPILFKQMRLSPGLPTVGDEILGFGYHGVSHPIEIGTDGRQTIRYEQRGSFTKGRVLEIHAEQRDSAMLRFPCFRTDARFDPGMSGGPVVNKVGDVCGVICDSLGPRADDTSTHDSYASLIWPVLGCEIEVAPAEGELVRPVRIEELIRSGYIVSDGSESKIQVKDTPGRANKIVTVRTDLIVRGYSSSKRVTRITRIDCGAKFDGRSTRRFPLS
jgi:hypothetical protein